MTSNVVPLRVVEVPSVEEILTYKSVYALCTVDKDGKALKATHYACVQIGGPYPTWVVLTVTGKFARYAGSRAQIERAYPKLIWRRKMWTWSAVDVTDKSLEKRRLEIEERFQRRLPRRVEVLA